MLVVLAITAAGCSEGSEATPACSRPDSSIIILEAQSVPTATQAALHRRPADRVVVRRMEARNDETVFWLDHDRAGIHAVEVSVRASCDISSAVQVPPSPDETDMRIYQQPTTLEPAFSGSRFQVFEGGCIEYRYSFSSDADPALVIEADQAVSTVPREDLVAAVADQFDLILCGAGAPPCEG